MAKSFEIRFAKEEEKYQIENLWSYSFHRDSKDFRQWYFNEYYRYNECLVAVDSDGIIYASLQLIETFLEKNTKKLKGAYIVGLDVMPEARDENLAKSLMEYAEFYAKKVGLDFLLLMPFEAGFYYRFGYSFVDYHYLFNLSMLEFFKTKSLGKFKKIDFKNPPYETLSKVYHGSQKRYLIKLIREKRHIDALINDTLIEGGYGYLYYRNNQPMGYLFYTLDDSFNVREFVYLDLEAKNALYNFILSHRSQVDRIKWSAPLVEQLAYERKVDKENVALYPFMMAKIINLSSWIPSSKEINICFNLKKDNEKIVTYQVDSNGLSKLDRIKIEADFELDEMALTKLAFGRHHVEQIYPNKVTNSIHWEAFVALFETGTVYFNEYF